MMMEGGQRPMGGGGGDQQYPPPPFPPPPDSLLHHLHPPSMPPSSSNHHHHHHHLRPDFSAADHHHHFHRPFHHHHHHHHHPNFNHRDCGDGVNHVKLYVVGVPRTATDQYIRSIFGEYGNVVEVVLLKDKITGQQRECCFVKFAKLEEAERAIRALNNQYTPPGGLLPIEVRYAEAKRERIGAFSPQDFKLHVNCLNKQASRREVEEIFSAYGLVESVYFLRDEMKQNRGDVYIQFSRIDMAFAAMNALNGTYVMRGCDRPLVVRFAGPKKPRVGDTSPVRGNSRFEAPGVGPPFREPVARPLQHHGGPFAGHALSNSSRPLNPNHVESCSQSRQSGSKPTTISSTSNHLVPSTISYTPTESESAQMTDPLDCDWSEHTCPDGYKYYFNCITCESRWEKPEEYTHYEQQLQKHEDQQNPSCQLPPSPSNSQVLSTEEVSQVQQMKLQTELLDQKPKPPSYLLWKSIICKYRQARSLLQLVSNWSIRYM